MANILKCIEVQPNAKNKHMRSLEIPLDMNITKVKNYIKHNFEDYRVSSNKRKHCSYDLKSYYGIDIEILDINNFKDSISIYTVIRKLSRMYFKINAFGKEERISLRELYSIASMGEALIKSDYITAYSLGDYDNITKINLTITSDNKASIQIILKIK